MQNWDDYRYDISIVTSISMSVELQHLGSHKFGPKHQGNAAEDEEYDRLRKLAHQEQTSRSRCMQQKRIREVTEQLHMS